MKISIETTAERLLNAQDILILSHRRPDGDTIGSAMGLHYALKSLGKRSRVECADPFPVKFKYIYEEFEDFEPKFIVAVDTATVRLLGGLMDVYGDKVDLSIDHHKTNNLFAKETYLDVSAPAVTEIMYMVLMEMNVELNKNMANSLFTGLVTDTGGFRFASVTARTFEVASKLLEGGAEHSMINKKIFESNSKGRMQVEQLAIGSIEYYLDDKCAVLYLPSNVMTEYGVLEEELDGMSSIPRTINGVEIGITIRDLGSNTYRISLRSQSPYDSSRICQTFGGGGHVNAAGCTMTGEPDEVKRQLLEAAKEEIERGGAC